VQEARELGVVAEDVELPRGPRISTEDVALVADAIDDVADGGFDTGQVGVGLVVGATDEFHPPLGEQLPQVGQALRVHVEERLQVIDLGEDEPVVAVA
jgi:hypothetical protein